ncbi:hypothetical protein CAC42_1342 [Sphaceloma murrayae]|uniref:Uncharacterized protein n=1 Tax=Sphaceloma murrayae TaxID=2082308 RepID=A0A2K1QG41_9PEZI|nr:hypothetical protein CAC42_1342 [Sphaceloma murrayae]
MTRRPSASEPETSITPGVLGKVEDICRRVVDTTTSLIQPSDTFDNTTVDVYTPARISQCTETHTNVTMTTQPSPPPPFRSPTFCFSTPDSNFSIQYYNDWRAPSELISADCLLIASHVAVLTWEEDGFKTTLHCRDPRLGDEAVYLHLMLRHVEAKDVRTTILALPRYRVLLECWEMVHRARVWESSRPEAEEVARWAENEAAAIVRALTEERLESMARANDLLRDRESAIRTAFETALATED